jgi:hypothetical protein
MRSGTTLIVIRIVIAVLMAALGAAQIANGNVVVGGLLIALAAMNVIRTVVMTRRREQIRRRLAERRAQRVGTGGFGGPAARPW